MCSAWTLLSCVLRSFKLCSTQSCVFPGRALLPSELHVSPGFDFWHDPSANARGAESLIPFTSREKPFGVSYPAVPNLWEDGCSCSLPAAPLLAHKPRAVSMRFLIPPPVPRCPGHSVLPALGTGLNWDLMAHPAVVGSARSSALHSDPGKGHRAPSQAAAGPEIPWECDSYSFFWNILLVTQLWLPGRWLCAVPSHPPWWHWGRAV